MQTAIDSERRIGLFHATTIGVGAIVGGGILALAGTAFATTGPGALVAFAANGVIAIVTALSFAELATVFPRSGGTYVFAKRVLSVGRAFAVGWIVWFASIIAATLYAVGFASFVLNAIDAATGGAAGSWLTARSAVTAVAVAATGGASMILARSRGGGGVAVNVVKVGVFVVLIAGGLSVWAGRPGTGLQGFRPFLSQGAAGLVQAMGYTFIALQGFDLVAAVAGEVRDPRRTLPRAMLASLGIALVIYLPILALIPAVGVPAGTSVVEMATRNPDTLVAEAARLFLGPVGFWLVMSAGVLAMFSALLANLFAASHIAHAMSRERTLPHGLEIVHPRWGTPVRALVATATIVIGSLVLIGDVAAAGAASSLIFLISFALTHVLCVVTRRRSPRHSGFRVPWFPYLPIGGAVACSGLAVFQGITVPAAGFVAGVWLLAGVIAYLRLFGPRARVQDAALEAADETLLELRGRSPLVLVPVANPANADVMALMAACMSPPRVGRVLLLNVIDGSLRESPERLADGVDAATHVVRESLTAALGTGVRIEAMLAISADPWQEIGRVARHHRCASLLVGLTELSDAAMRGRLENLASSLTCNVVVFRAPPGWRPENVRRALVPVGGMGMDSVLRARLLTGLHRRAARDLHVVYLVVLPEGTSDAACARTERAYSGLLRDEYDASAELLLTRSAKVPEAIVDAATDCDLVVLGLSRVGRKRRIFSETTRLVVAKSSCAIMVISEPA